MVEKYANGRGFQALTAEQRKKVASQGGKAAHTSGNAHHFTSEEAKEAGKKSLAARQAKARQRVRDAGGRVPEDDEAHECLDQLD